MTMKKTLATLAIIATLALTGCSSQEEGQRSTPVPHLVELADGRIVDCIVFKHGYAGGLSCDWAGAK